MSRLHIQSNREALFWIVLGVVAAVSAGLLFRSVFPFAPAKWSATREQAVDIALERLRDVGELPEDPYVVATLILDPLLEMRLLEDLPPADRTVFDHSRLARQVAVWTVTVYGEHSSPGDWLFRAEVGVDGEVVSLLRRFPAAEPPSGRLSSREARDRADRFLRDMGLDPESYGAALERRSDQTEGQQDLSLRYVDREALLGSALSYGIEVEFSGDRLQGFHAWVDDPELESLSPLLRQAQLFQTLWIFGGFLLLPPVGVIFVRRYHEGLVGVGRASQIFWSVWLALVFVLLLTLRASAEGSAFGNLSRQQMTWVWGGIMGLIYFPTVALLGFFGWSLGESLCPQQWRSKLSSFDAALRGQMTNGTVASASLRGAALGLLQVVVLLGGAGALARGLEVKAPVAFLLGPWWENASWPGVSLLLLSFGYTLGQGLFAYLLLLPALSQRIGRVAAGLVVSAVAGLLFFPAVTLLPTAWGIGLSAFSAAFGVVIFLLFDLLTVLLASLVAAVGLGALPFLFVPQPELQFQGWLALLLALLPLWLSLRWVGSERRYVYQRDDVPPHVRRIAARERQRIELETARRIQSSILPDLPSQVSGIDVAYTYLPASEVGGDFYDLLALEDGRLSVAIGDVAGHGVSSGLIMSMARSALAVQVAFRPEVEEVLETLNRVVYQSARRRLLTTLCYALLDPENRRLVYASAGHLYPYRVSRDGTVASLPCDSYPLGARPHLEVRAREVRLLAGDALFLASDGLVEARPPASDDLYGFERLEESLGRHAGESVQQLLDGVLGDLAAHAGRDHLLLESDQRQDDLTVLVLGLPPDRALPGTLEQAPAGRRS